MEVTKWVQGNREKKHMSQKAKEKNKKGKQMMRKMTKEKTMEVSRREWRQNTIRHNDQSANLDLSPAIRTSISQRPAWRLNFRSPVLPVWG